jgi:hypothetical protein
MSAIFSRPQGARFSWKILYKISLCLVVQRCVNRTFEAAEIPTFAGGIMIVDNGNDEHDSSDEDFREFCDQ